MASRLPHKPEVIDRIVDVYRSISKHPSVASGCLFNSNNVSKFVKIQSRWNQRNLEKKEISKFQKFHIVDSSNSVIDMHPVDTSTELITTFSQSEKYVCTVREIVPSKELSLAKKRQYLEVWENNLLYKNFDIEDFDVHGLIYGDGEFGSLEWSPDESKILYIAEKKAPKCQPFYKQKQPEPKQQKQSDSKTVLVGQEYLYKPTWGEQLVDKHQPVVVMCNLSSESLEVLEGIPSNFSPGQVIWAKDGEGLFGIVLENEPRRLGLIYCTNRRGYIFHLSLKGEFTILSEENKSVRSPRLSPDGKTLFWLQRPAEGVHDGCQELVKRDLASGKIEVVIPIVRKPSSEFCGIYSHSLPRRCFSNDGKLLFFSTINKTRLQSFYVDTGSKVIRPVKFEASSVMLDVHNDMMLITTSSFKSPPSLYLSRSIRDVEWIPISVAEEVVSDSVVKHLEFNLEKHGDDFVYFNAIFFAPPRLSDNKIPLVVCPHGGPHSCVTDTFSLEAAYFASLGFAVLYVNYRGSTGSGQDGVEFLPGKISNTDVKDNHYVVNQILSEASFVDPEKLVLFGGSHGGFLVTHLSAQYPDTYKAVVARNPVVDVFGMYSTTDIPDWDTIESGFPFNEAIPLNEDEGSKMLKVSPIYLANKIKAPTFLMVGKKDLRVPPSQGIYLYNTLKARNVKTRLNVYEDNHPLGQVPVHMDSLINATLWFFEHLGMS